MTLNNHSRKEIDLTISLQQLPTPVFAPTAGNSQDHIRILMLKHKPYDELLIVRALEKSGMGIQTDRATCAESFKTALQTFEPDVVFTDGFVDHQDTRVALEILREVRPTAPMIVVTDGLTGSQTVSMVRAGVADVVLKQDLVDLPGVVSRVLEARRDVQKLTARQIEVLQLVAAGLRTRDIADRLGLSVKTVETHRGEIMKRLRVHDVVGLARYAIRVGLVPWS
jgi:DNA-binding NarL/FixJ family response regulator